MRATRTALLAITVSGCIAGAGIVQANPVERALQRAKAKAEQAVTRPAARPAPAPEPSREASSEPSADAATGPAQSNAPGPAVRSATRPARSDADRAAGRDAARARAAEASKARDNPPVAAGPVQDQGIQGPLHAANVNRIVFTRSDLGMNEINAAAIVLDFTLGQPMFFRVYTDKSAVNAIAAATNRPAASVYADGVFYTARFTIDGQTFDTSMFPWGQANAHRTWTTWRGQFVNPNRFVRVPGTDVFMEMLSRATGAGLLRPGRHAIRMELIANTTTERDGPISAGVVAAGSFNLSVPAGVFQASNSAVCGPTRGGAGSPAMEARALDQARRFWDKPDLTPVKAIGVGEEWNVERHPVTGIPLERSTPVEILTRGARFCTRQTHTYTERYMGSAGFSTATGGISVNWTPGYVPCACLG